MSLEKVDGNLPWRDGVLYAFQHIVAMCTGIMALPLIIGGVLGLDSKLITTLIAAGFMVSGIGTFILSSGIIKKFGIRLLVIEGSSFVCMLSLLAIAGLYKGDGITGLRVMFGATIAVGILTIIAAPLFGKLLKYFPQLVSGIVILLLGISLSKTVAEWISKGADNKGLNLLVALLTLVIIVLFQKFGKGIIGNLAVLFGLLFGTMIAGMFGMTDLSKVSQMPVVEINKPMFLGVPLFNIEAIITLAIVQITAVVESLANQINLTKMSHEKADNSKLVDGIRGHGLTTLMAGIFNSFPQTLFSQNVALVGMSNVVNKRIGMIAGGILVLVSCFPKVIACMTLIPSPVLGGAGLIMFGVITANGIKMLGSLAFKGNKNLIIIAASMTMGMLPLMSPEIFKNLPEMAKLLLENGVILGAIVAIVLNIFFHGLRDESEHESH